MEGINKQHHAAEEISHEDFLHEFDQNDKEKIQALKTIFSDDPDLGDYIIEKICERKEMALPLIHTLYNLIGNISKTQEFLTREFKTADARSVAVAVHNKLIKKAQDILLKYNAKSMGVDQMGEIALGAQMAEDNKDIVEEFGYDVDDADEREKSWDDAEQELLIDAQLEMSELNVNQIIFLNSFKLLKDNGVDFSLDDITNSSFQKVLGTEIAPEQLEQMRSMYETNQSANPAVQQELLNSLAKKISDGKTNFYLFSYMNNIQSFVALTPSGDGTLYASAFNVAPDARGYKIGEAMLIEVIDKEAREHVLVADCNASLPISAKYIETGWVATRFWNDHGDKILDIRREDTRNNEYSGKKLSKEDIIAGKVPHRTLVETSNEQKNLPFSLCNEGYILTRMFFDQETARHYAVFESAPPFRTEQGTSADAFHI